MLNIIVNGKSQTVPEYTTAVQLLDNMGLTGKRIAMEINEEILPRSQFERYQLKTGDKIEIVHAIGGG